MTTPTTCPGCGRQTESSLPACQFCNFRWAVWNRAAPPASAPASAPITRAELTQRAVGILLDAEASRLPAASAPDALTLETLDLWTTDYEAWLEAPDDVPTHENALESRFAALIAFARERLTVEVTP